jgi:hypothetical protein
MALIMQLIPAQLTLAVQNISKQLSTWSSRVCILFGDVWC